MDISQLMRLVRAASPLTIVNYPKREGLEGELALKFDIGHVRTHHDMNWGAIQSVIQAFDHTHNGGLDRHTLCINAVKLLGSSAGLCELLGLSEEEVIRILQQEFRPQGRP